MNSVPEFGIPNYTWTFGHMGNMFMCCLEMYTWTHMNEPTTNVKLLMHCHHRGLKNSRMPPPCLGRFAALAAGVRLGVGAEANVAAYKFERVFKSELPATDPSTTGVRR